MGFRLYIRINVAGLALCSFCCRCFRTTHRRLACEQQHENGLRARCLEQALYARQRGHADGLIHHSDRGSQYVSIRYTERLADAGVEPSVGSKGDSYDNALAETINGLYKAELIHRQSWRSREAVEIATLKWVHWYNHQRLLGSIGYIPPAEAEANFYQQHTGRAVAA